jgi:hypothetical protein
MFTRATKITAVCFLIATTSSSAVPDSGAYQVSGQFAAALGNATTALCNIGASSSLVHLWYMYHFRVTRRTAEETLCYNIPLPAGGSVDLPYVISSFMVMVVVQLVFFSPSLFLRAVAVSPHAPCGIIYNNRSAVSLSAARAVNRLSAHKGGLSASGRTYALWKAKPER